MSRKDWGRWVKALTDADQQWAQDYLLEKGRLERTRYVYQTQSESIMTMIQHLKSSVDGLRILDNMDNYHRHKRSKEANKKSSTTIYLSLRARTNLKKLAKQTNRNLSDTVEYLINRASDEGSSKR